MSVESARAWNRWFLERCLFSLSSLKYAECSSCRRRGETRTRERLRMTVEFFMKVSATMVRSFLVKGKKQKFGSTLSTVIDVRISFFHSLIPVLIPDCRLELTAWSRPWKNRAGPWEFLSDRSVIPRRTCAFSWRIWKGRESSRVVQPSWITLERGEFWYYSCARSW